MPRPLPARRSQFLAVAALAGTTVVTGALAAATPAMAAPVAIGGFLTEVPEGAPSTGAETYFAPVALTNGDTAYGIHEDQPLAPVGELVLDDGSYAVAQPFDDPATGWENVVGEKVGDAPVYWEPANAALAGYILSVFGSTEDADEALAVHWAVRSLSTAAAPAPEVTGPEEAHLERAAFMIQDAQHNVPSLTPRDGYRVSVSFEPTGQPDTLLVQMPEAYDATTVTLSGPVTFADGTTTMTFTGGDRDKYLELAVPEGVTEGTLTADLTASMPSTELTVLAHDEYRDLLIAGQERTVAWSASAGFEIDEPTAPGGDVTVEETAAPGDGGADDGGSPEAPADSDNGADSDSDNGADNGADNGVVGVPGTRDADDTAGPGPDGAVRDRDSSLLEIAPDADSEQKLTATLEAFVLFEEQTSTHTEVVTETTMTAGGAAYADPAMANTGMGTASATSGRSATTSVALAVVAVGAALGAWALRRRKPAAPDQND